MAITPDSAYDDGVSAYKDGKDFYNNPHVSPTSKKDDFNSWCAGWIYARQNDINGTNT